MRFVWSSWVSNWKRLLFPAICQVPPLIHHLSLTPVECPDRFVFVDIIDTLPPISFIAPPWQGLICGYSKSGITPRDLTCAWSNQNACWLVSCEARRRNIHRAMARKSRESAISSRLSVCLCLPCVTRQSITSCLLRVRSRRERRLIIWELANSWVLWSKKLR